MKKVVYGLIICLLSVTFLTGCGKKNEGIKNNDNLRIDWSESFDKSEIIVQITNENNYDIGVVDITYTYKDENDKVISTDTDYIYNFKSKGRFANSYETIENEDGSYEVPAKVEITAEIDKEYQEEMGNIISYTDKIATSYTKGNEEIEVTLKNNSEKEIANVDGLVLFKKNNKAIATRRLYSDGFRDTFTTEVPIPVDFEASDEDYKLIDYDDVEIVINDATPLYTMDDME